MTMHTAAVVRFLYWRPAAEGSFKCFVSFQFLDIACPCAAAVGEFRKLALLAEGDGHLRQKLQQVLKLSKEKWDDARDHAMRAVVADNRMRIW